MTSVLPLVNPIRSRSFQPMSTPYYSTPQMASPHMVGMKKDAPSPYEGHSSGSEKKQTTPGAKRRPSRAGTRSVTTLTAAQLERKRANDREAQRAIRQRTKDHIENLERRIAELTASHENNNPSKTIELMRRNEELEQENAMLRTRLSHAVSALGGQDSMSAANVMGPQDSNMLSAAATGGAPSPSDRVQMLSQPRRSSTGTARSVHSVHSVPEQATPVSQSAHWQPQHPAYTPNIPSPHLENAPQIGEVSGPTDQVRWSPHPHPHPHQQQHHAVSMSVTDPSMHAVDSSGMAYSNPYVMDPSNRPMNYQLENQQMVAPQPMQQMGTGYGTPTSNPSPHPPEYQRHLNVPMNHPPSQQQSQYPSYPTQHQSYVPQVSHPQEMQMMQQPQAMMGEQGHMMYQMHSQMKVEPH